ncbi:MAG TPA: OstA-like protein [Bacteroidales bacterium]|nr:OstA-like protein [Bacteroidales bacterium]HRZ49644.1 OstA-like protein [Bacteroidales bacterium]
MNYRIRAIFRLFFLAWVFGAAGTLYAQKRVEWIYSDYVEYDQVNFGKVRRAIGSVQFRHQGTLMLCDSAYFYEETNIVEAFSNVHIQDSDTLNLYCDFLKYLPSTGMATAFRNVVLVDPQVSLTTDELTYDINRNIAWYDKGGKIVSRTNTLTSKKGTYYADRKQFIFEDDVVLMHPKFTLYTDTLHYHTPSEIADVFGATLIRGDESLIYTERGTYDTRRDFSICRKNSWMQNKDTRISGDSITYDRNLEFSRAFRNVKIQDTVSSVILGGHLGEYAGSSGYAWLTDSAWAEVWDKEDTLVLQSDTLYITYDTLRNGREFFGYHHVRFFRSDLQGVCDSMAYHFADSVMYMFAMPVIWNEKTQITADTITLYFVNQKLDSMRMTGNGFIISEDRDPGYNQVKGYVITGFFKDRELDRLFVDGGTETLYYAREENGGLIGIDKARSEQMRMEFLKGEIETIVYLKGVSGTTYPEKELNQTERFLKGFLIREAERPVSRYDLNHKAE